MTVVDIHQQFFDPRLGFPSSWHALNPHSPDEAAILSELAAALD
jgi:hypothetical protein